MFVTTAKSNVVNQNRGSPQNPPQSQSTSRLTSFAMASQITKVEIFVRNFAALGQCKRFPQVLGFRNSFGLTGLSRLCADRTSIQGYSIGGPKPIIGGDPR